MREPWRAEVAERQGRELAALRSERGLILPFAVIAHGVFWGALLRHGADSPAAALSMVVAATLTLWIVGLQGRIAGVDLDS